MVQERRSIVLWSLKQRNLYAVGQSLLTVFPMASMEGETKREFIQPTYTHTALFTQTTYSKQTKQEGDKKKFTAAGEIISFFRFCGNRLPRRNKER